MLPREDGEGVVVVVVHRLQGGCGGNFFFFFRRTPTLGEIEFIRNAASRPVSKGSLEKGGTIVPFGCHSGEKNCLLLPLASHLKRIYLDCFEFLWIRRGFGLK